MTSPRSDTLDFSSPTSHTAGRYTWPVDLNDALKRMTAEVAEMRKMRDVYRERLESIEVDLHQLMTEVEVLEEVRDRYMSDLPGDGHDAKTPSWRNLNRQEATLRALTEPGRPLTDPRNRRVPEIGRKV